MKYSSQHSMQHPIISLKTQGNDQHNYKHDQSINSLAVCNDDIKFGLIDVRHAGSWSDVRVLEHSTFGKPLNMWLPADHDIYGWSNKLSYCIVADEALSLKTWCTLAVINMKYPFLDLTSTSSLYKSKSVLLKYLFENCSSSHSKNYKQNLLAKSHCINKQKLIAVATVHMYLRSI